MNGNAVVGSCINTIYDDGKNKPKPAFTTCAERKALIQQLLDSLNK